MAQEAPQEPQADEGAAIIVTGTRATGMQAAESAAPVAIPIDPPTMALAPRLPWLWSAMCIDPPFPRQ